MILGSKDYGSYAMSVYDYDTALRLCREAQLNDPDCVYALEKAETREGLIGYIVVASGGIDWLHGSLEP